MLLIGIAIKIRGLERPGILSIKTVINCISCMLGNGCFVGDQNQNATRKSVRKEITKRRKELRPLLS